MQLGSRIAVVVAKAGSYSSDLTPAWPGNLHMPWYGPQKKLKKKKKGVGEFREKISCLAALPHVDKSEGCGTQAHTQLAWDPEGLPSASTLGCSQSLAAASELQGSFCWWAWGCFANGQNSQLPG